MPTKTIAQLTAAPSAQAADELEIDRPGTPRQSLKVTASQLAELARAGLVEGANITLTLNPDGTLTIASTASGGVTSVGASDPLSSSGGATPVISHDTSGVTTGTYDAPRITIDAYGHITAAEEAPAMRYQPNDLQTATDPSYYGYSDKDGAWWIKRLDETTSPATLTHATTLNNPSYSTYSAAWTARASLTYGRYDQAF